jgi:preprotein translocase subunit YajC
MPAPAPPLLALLQAPSGPGSLIGSFLPIVLVFGLAWFLLIRPAQQQRREQETMRSALRAGDPVLTSGGVYGTVVRVKDDRVVLRVSEGVNLDVAKSAVVSVLDAKERE